MVLFVTAFPAEQINTADISQLKQIWKYLLNQKGGWANSGS
jgi:hypothetical protein